MISNDPTLSTILLFDIIFHGQTRTLDTNSFGMARIPEKIRIAAIGPAWLEQSQQKGAPQDALAVAELLPLDGQNRDKNGPIKVSSLVIFSIKHSVLIFFWVCHSDH